MPYSDLTLDQKTKYLSEGNRYFQRLYCLDYVKWQIEFLFICVQRTVEEKMNCRFNFVTTVTERINQILKTMFKFMLKQMTEAKTKSSHKFYALGLWELYAEFEVGRISCMISFLKINRLLELQRSSLIYYIRW